MNIEIKAYSEVELRKLIQFDRTIIVTQFLRQHQEKLNENMAFTFKDQATQQIVIFDRVMYLITLGMGGKLFNQLIDLGLKEEVKGIIVKSSPTIENQASNLDEL